MKRNVALIISYASEIPPEMRVSGFMGYQGKSSQMLYERFGDLKFKYRTAAIENDGDFDKAKFAKITAETLKIRRRPSARRGASVTWTRSRTEGR